MTRFTVDNQNRLIFYDNPVGYAVPEERRAVADPRIPFSSRIINDEFYDVLVDNRLMSHTTGIDLDDFFVDDWP